MKAFREIGSRKLLRFVFFSLWYALFRVVLFPPIRVWLLQAVGAKIGRETVVHDIRLFNFYRTGPKGLTIGKFCFLGDEVMLDLAGTITLEDQVTLSNRTFVLTHTNVGFADHPLQRYIKSTVGEVVFKRGAFTGVNVTILPNVTVKEGGAAAAGAVVNQDIPEYSVVGGVPAKILKKFREN